MFVEYTVAMVFWGVASALLCGCLDVMDGCYGVTKVF